MGLLTFLFRAATPENPRFNLNDPAAWDALGAEPASSGVKVNRDSALTYGPWWRGINLISSDVAKLPCYIYQRQATGKRRAPEHPGYYLIRRKPNSRQTSFQFRRQLTSHALSEGNGYAYIFRAGSADAEELLPLDPTVTSPVLANGVLWYVTKVGNEQRKLRAEDVLHIRGFNFDGLSGYSVYDKARESLGIGIGARKYGSVYFRNNAKPSIVIQVPNRMEEKARQELRNGWERMSGGLDNAHRTAVLDNGAQIKEFGFNARDSQLIEAREFEVREIANFLGLPPHKLGDTTAVSYASVEMSDQQYLNEALDPWLVNWEEECWDKLLREEEKQNDTYFIEFDRRALIRADLAARSAYYQKSLAGMPWQAVNEVRDDEGLNPVEGGDEIQPPANISGKPPTSEPPPPPKPPLQKKPPKENQAALEAHRALIVETAGRMVRRIGTHARKAAKQPAEFLDWLDGLETEHAAVIAEVLKAPIAACADWVTTNLKPPSLAVNITHSIRSALLEVSGTCKASELAGAVDKVMTELESSVPKEFALMLLGEEGEP